MTSCCSVAYADDVLLNPQLQLGVSALAPRGTVSPVYQAVLKNC